MRTRLYYMDHWFKRESIADLVSDELTLYYYNEPKDSVPKEYKKVDIDMTHGRAYNSAISCSNMMVLSQRIDNSKLNVENGAITFRIIADEKEYTFEIDRNLIKYGEKNKQKEGYLLLKGEQADLYFSKFSYYNYGESDGGNLNLTGLLCIH